jgi:hypothetical protein
MADPRDVKLMQARLLRAHEMIYQPRKPTHLAPNRVALHEFAANHIGLDCSVRYLEFGVHTGVSIRRFSSLFVNPSAKFVGFDSFEGLPEAWAHFQAGHFSTDGRTPVSDDTRVEFVKGWFQNTARDFLSKTLSEPEKVTLVHFDADLYSSTLFLLALPWWHIPEYFFVMDEFVDDELVALADFMSGFPVEVEFFSRTDNSVGYPVQVFGHLRATKMVVRTP